MSDLIATLAALGRQIRDVQQRLGALERKIDDLSDRSTPSRTDEIAKEMAGEILKDARPSQKKAAPATDLAKLPALLTIRDMSAIYRVSPLTIRRGLHDHTWAPLPFDKYPYRWLKSDIVRDLQTPRKKQRMRPHGFAHPTTMARRHKTRRAKR